MIKHMIIWSIKQEFTGDEKKKIMEDAKRELEALKGRIDGLIDIKLQISKLDSSNGDMMLHSTFTDVQSLNGYSVHPEHVAVADKFVRPFTQTRLCMDFEV